MIRDKNMEWLEKRVFIPAQGFQTFVTGAGISAGNPVFQEISTFGISGIQINQANDSISHVMMLPYDLDPTFQIRVRVWLTSSSTDGDAETITVVHKLLGRGTALAAPATALDTAIPAYTFSSTAYALGITDFGVINANTVTTSHEAIVFDVASTMTNASANEISILGIEFCYTPRRLAGPQYNLRAARRLTATAPMGTALATTQES